MRNKQTLKKRDFADLCFTFHSCSSIDNSIVSNTFPTSRLQLITINTNLSFLLDNTCLQTCRNQTIWVMCIHLVQSFFQRVIF